MNTLSQNHERRIETFQPQFSTGRWKPISEFVRTVARDVGAPTDELMRRRLIHIARFVLWCWESCGMPLDRSDIFTAHHVLEFASVRARTLAGGSVTRERTLLLTVIEELGHKVPASTADSTTVDTRRSPYSVTELAMLRSWAGTQRSHRRRHNAAMMLALGAGGGLRPEELRTIRRNEIEQSAEGTTAHLASRSVPLLREWEALLHSALSNSDVDDFVFRTEANRDEPGLLTGFIRATSGIEIKPLPQRLRTTWLVTLLQARVPFPALLDAAGLRSLTSLTPYLQFIAATGDESAALRDAGARR